MQKNYNENLVAGAAIRDDKGRRISKLFESPHPKMTVGYAKNLIMPNDPTEQEFNFRQAGGGVIEDGVAVIDKVKGNSVVWNQPLNPQLVQYARMNVVEDMGTALKVQVNERYPSIQCPVSLIKGHKYLAIFNHTTVNVYTTEGFYFDVNGVKEYTSDSKSIRVLFQDNQDYGAYPVEQTYEKPLLYDLTRMFGAGNEPSTYEEFLQRKPKVADEYAYNEGTIVNNKVEAIKAQGRNLATSDILLSTSFVGSEFTNASLHRGTYCISLDTPQAITLYVALFDKNGNNISSSASSLGEGWALNSNMSWWYHTIDSGGKLSFSLAKDAIVSVKTNVTLSRTTHIMLNVGTTSLPYEPYEEHTLDLSWVKDIKDADGAKLFEDGMKSVGNAFDEVGKNKAVKRIRVVDLEELEWQRNTSPTEENGMMCRFFVKPTGLALKPNFSNCILSPKFGYTNDLRINASYNHTCFSYEDGRVFFNIALAEVGEYSSDAMRTYMQGVPLYYELAEPIEVEYDEKNLTYPVVAGGTEEAIASEPSTAFRSDIGYGIDAVKTILDLKARVKALEGK